MSDGTPSHHFGNVATTVGSLTRGAEMPAVQSTVRNQNQRRTAMTQKIIEVVGTSKESFAKAAENAVAEAAKTVRGMKWARVAELEMELDGKKIAKYRATTKIYFDIEK
jgi:flavin-binding protein dodecin